MVVLEKVADLSLIAFLLLAGSMMVTGQDRPRVVATSSSRPLNQPPPATETSRPSVSVQPTNRVVRPTLTNEINLTEPPKQLVKKTAAVAPAVGTFGAGRTVYGSSMSSLIMRGIQARLGIPYLYGSTGPNRYDCSGFVWSVFRDAGIDFVRSSARSLWTASVPVEGEDRYKFGTLVFMNNLGHMGIVADENGFYHASSSKGITYSPFKGYWEKRIVGFRRLPAGPPSSLPPAIEE